MRVVAEVPAWMIADGEYGDVAVGARAEFGFAVVPSSWSVGAGTRSFRQPDGTGRAAVSGVVVQRSPDVPPVLDDGSVFPILATADPASSAGAAVDVEGRLLVEPFHWATDGPLWPQFPDGVRLWTVAAIECMVGGSRSALVVLPRVEDVDHDATYLVALNRS